MSRIRLKVIIDEIRGDDEGALRIATHYYEEGGRPLTHTYTDGECPEIEGQRKTYSCACEKLALGHRMSVYQTERWFGDLHLGNKDVGAFIDALVAAGIWVEIVGVKHIETKE